MTKTRALRLAREMGGVVGRGNSKVGTWSTYRPVGPSCPQRCEMHPAHYDSPAESPCYATDGRVNLAQRRAGSDRYAAAAAFAAALIASSEEDGRPFVRLHTSGDLFEDGHIDMLYVRTLSRTARAHGGSREHPVAWGYTHADPSIGENRRAVGMLRDAGVAIRWSGARGRWGAIVLPHADASDRASFRREARSVGAFACPAQYSETVTCASCRACADHPERAVAFAPDGTTGKRIRNTAARRRLKVL